MSIKPVISLIRPHQWVKNVFVVAPLFFTPTAVSYDNIIHVLLGFMCFCAIASSVYIINDYADREADSKHPTKNKRPLAAGTISVTSAFILYAILLIIGAGGAFILGKEFAYTCLGYIALNLVYSVWLKKISIIDVICISICFILRVEAGAKLINVEPSVWIIICTGLLALFLAIAKRRDDVVRKLRAEHRRSLNGYTRYYLDVSLTMVLGALLVSYMIYTTDSAVMEKMGTDRLYLTAPFVLAGMLRYLQITIVEEKSGSPTRIVLTDAFIIITVMCWIAMFSFLMYM